MLLARLLSWPVAWYIRRHRDLLAEQGIPLGADERAWLQHYFPQDLLERVRIVERDPLPILSPPLRGFVRALGFDFPDISEVSAITFDSVIAARRRMSNATLFHELVHVAQYRELGIAEFAKQYTQGLLATRSYEEIPLEAQAFALEDRLLTDPCSFDVLSLLRQPPQTPSPPRPPAF